MFGSRKHERKETTTLFLTVSPVRLPVPVAARSKACVYGRSPAAIMGSNPTGGMNVCCCEGCVLSGRGLCDDLITRPEESYRLWCVVCDLETTKILVNEEEAKAH